MRRPIIGVVAHALPAVPGERPAAFAIGRKYVDLLRLSGALPWLIPHWPDAPEVLADLASRLDGVFLSGGPDLDPARYGESRHSRCGQPDPGRDATEFALLQHAEERSLPVFAVCRGMQVLNVFAGGTLYQDIPTQVPAALKHDYFPTPDHPSRDAIVHEVAVSPDSRLFTILGEAMIATNSLHHQAVKDIGPGLRASAFAPDGIIESLECVDANRFVLGVQWHPEELAETNPMMRELFRKFVESCGMN